ncbi:MAG: hypothetical protein AAGA02_14190 [Bacteroidota bacterium]
MRFLIFIGLKLVALQGIAQVEHNFTMGPNNTTCDSLETDGASNLIELVRSTKFRLAEELKVSRYKVPKHVWFYSCNGKTGYLIARETDEIEILFKEVNKEDWNILLDSKDPITAYQKLKSKYIQD